MDRPLEKLCADRRSWMSLAALALLVRLVAWLERADRATLTGMLDTRTYRDLAASLVDGGFVPDQAFFMSPLYPYLMALIERPFGAATLLVLQCLLGVGALCILAWVVRRRAGAVTGSGVLFLGALAPPLILYDTSLLPDGPATACVALALAGLLSADRPSRRALWTTGIALAVGTALRPNLLLLFPLLVGAWLWRRRGEGASVLRRALPLALPMLLVLATISGLNAAAEGLWAPRSYNAGLNLYIGNNPTADGTYTPVDQIHPGDPLGRQAAERARGRSLDSAGIEEFWREQALRFWTQQPGAAARLFLTKAALFFHPVEIPQMEDLALAARESRVLGLAPFGFGLLLGLAVLGAWQPLVRVAVPRWPLLIAVGSALLVAVVFFVNGRLRLPVWPPLLVLAGLGLGQLIEAYRRRRLAPLIAPLAVVVGLRIGLLMLPMHETFLHARSAARYAAIEALAGHDTLARQWLLVMDEIERTPARWGEGRAIDASFRAEPGSRHLLQMEKAAALYALGSDRSAFEALLQVVRARPDHLRAWRGLFDVTGRMLQAGVQDERVRQAHAAARRHLSATP